MHTIRTRLFINYLIVLLLGMTLVSMLVWLAVSDLYVKSQSENLLAQAKLIAASLQDSSFPTQPIEPYSQTTNVQPGIHARLIGESGAVVVGLPLSEAMIQMSAAEEFAVIPPSELLLRSEIKLALSGMAATAQRRVLDNERVLYAAVPVNNSNGQITGIVYLATPLPSGGLPLSMILQLLGAVLIAVFIAGIAGRVLARKFAVPLETFANAATAVSKGDLNQTVLIYADISEFQSLSETFNLMVAKLRQADDVKKAFIADVTHELRTPLTVIKGTIETLEDGALDDVEGRGSLLTSMMRETDRMIRMVNELLVLTRADAGSLVLNLQKVDFAELARMRCEALHQIALRKRVELRFEGDSHIIAADPDRISQILDNLLVNAIRHSPENSKVTVSICSKYNGVECSVCDEGAGIPATHLPHIFDRFYRVEASRDRISGGTGLGLAIARALLTAHGGSIFAASIDGRGTKVTFWLPLKNADQLTDI